MKVLFIHQNFPGQYKHLAIHLVQQGHEVYVLTPESNKNELPSSRIKKFTYKIDRGNAPSIHPWVIDLETKVIRAEACARAAIVIRDQGFSPDIVINHPGWGESLLLKEVWCDAKLLSHGEFYYRHTGFDVGFDPEFDQAELFERSKLTLKNINADIYLSEADAVVTSTKWQAKSFPQSAQKRIHVIHEGIETETLTPKPREHLRINYANKDPVSISRDEGIVTFVSRDLEPMRGFHQFMRSLPSVLNGNTKCQILIIGGDGTGYGVPIKKISNSHRCWKDYMLSELKDELPESLLNRIHFLGRLPYDAFMDVLNISTVHVYLTYPFVLSWSLLEAMSLEKTIIASDTPPVKEVIESGKNGLLVDFFNHKKLASRILEVLKNPDDYGGLSVNARQTIIEQYDLQRVILPKYDSLIGKLVECD